MIPEVLDVRVIQKKRLAFRPGARNRKIRPAPVKARRESRDRLLDSRCERDELRIVAAIQREVGNLPGLDQRGYGRRSRIDLRNLPFHGDGLLGLADLQGEVNHSFAADRQGNAPLHGGLKALHRYLGLVFAYDEIRNSIPALRVRGHRASYARCCVFYLDRGATDDRAGSIRNGSQDGSIRGLCA